jgi:hypothetical protein
MHLILLNGEALQLSLNKLPVNIGVGVIPAPVFCKMWLKVVKIYMIISIYF